MDLLPGASSPRTTPLKTLHFRGGLLTGEADGSQQLLMIAKDYDELRIKLDAALGKGTTPIVGIPPFPWFYRRRSWPIENRKQADFVISYCLQKVSDRSNMRFDRLTLIEIDFDSPLVPNNE